MSTRARLPKSGQAAKKYLDAEGSAAFDKAVADSRWPPCRLESLRDVLTIMERLGEGGTGFRSLTEAIDTTTPAGRMMMQMVVKERTKAGLDAAREEGRIGGRRPKLSDQQQSEIRKMITNGDKTAADAARLFKVHPATVSRLLARPSSRKVSRAK
jgi:DNA invertase Pin-like site-specific DNA recombinase